MTRTLRLSREMWIFLGVTSVMSAIYLIMTTGQSARDRVKPPEITPSTLNAGQMVDVGITLITADAFGLACASDSKVGDAHCAFKTDGSPWRPEAGAPPEKAEDQIAPYMTVDNVLFLIPGLFTDPVLKKRVEDEPPSKFSREELEQRRFTVTCKMKVEQEMKALKVRWAPTAEWQPREKAWVGRVSDCKFTGGLAMAYASALFAPGVFDGQVALVTGGGTGIGLASARELGALGARLVIASRTPERVAAGAAALEADGREVLAMPCDIREPDQCKRLVDAAMERFGRIDVLVNNAGGQFPSPAESLSPRGWDAVIRNNLNGTFYMTHAAVNAAMIPARRGRIVNVIAVISRGFPGMAHTGAARAGVENLTKSLAVEWAPYNIQVNSVAPGTIRSSGTAQYGEALLEESRKATPAKRLGTPEEVARVVAFLASQLASYVTGSTYYIDGGSSLWGNIWPIGEPPPPRGEGAS